MGHSNASSGGGSASGPASHEPGGASHADLAARQDGGAEPPAHPPAQSLDATQADPASPGPRQQDEPGTAHSEGQSENVSFPQSSSTQASDMAPPFSTSFPESIPEASLSEEVGHPPSDQHPSSGHVDDTETPRILPNAGQDIADLSRLPDPHLTPRSSLSDTDKRHSMSSLASFTSGRGFLPSSAASVTGSDPGAPGPRCRPTPKPSIRSMQSEASASTAPATASSSSASPQPGGHQYLSPRDGQQGPSDAPKRNPGSRSDVQRQQLHRSRSRAQRRFSGSHATSSHSPASDRVSSQKEKEEGQFLPVAYRQVEKCGLTPRQ